ncbi:hypothetical protein SDRG_12864 [Saprolegnia diclina VS20]|uniref:BHLH domain-containing protein n=1 Tax=Saprolegnia diclina (strain VS20) TaxID=1156394 RepID=T0Q486_SAPDV|nr:hypothetical protein SDRG_12864 [Saprolegnia diclina VS20]EQC29401.1 hypothetical protein SDRG_12864 [Saprolegnia diclina VS20]|eukprot:XP_008617168.1 hypothetical protein SDRG_12864 [Saprolegnia diclina VS20]
MDFEDLSSMQIEDLGNFLNEQMTDGDGDSWKGFSLGYSDEDGSPSRPQAPPTTTTMAQDFHQATASLLSLPNSPYPTSFQSRQVIESAMLEFNEFSLEDKIAQHTKSKIHSMTNFEPFPMHGMPPLASMPHKPQSHPQPTMQSAAEPREQVPAHAPQWFKAASPVVSSHASTPTHSSHPSPTTSTTNTMKRPFATMEACSSDSCSTIANNDDDDRGYRKKSREKMRRQEVNVKFDELTSLLGMNDKVRKSAVLQEAVSCIKSLRRERDELRNDRDRLKQELSKLASCLQYSHMGSMAAANAMVMSQQLPPQHTAPMPPPGVCFPIGANFGFNFGSYMNPAPSGASTPLAMCPPIAPKLEASPGVGKPPSSATNAGGSTQL